MTEEPKKTEIENDTVKADELTDEALDEVAGGRMLNPQPLPPRHGGADF